MELHNLCFSIWYAKIKYVYRVSNLKVEHRQLTLCIQFIDIEAYSVTNML
jgi:hypothetical protein